MVPLGRESSQGEQLPNFSVPFDTDGLGSFGGTTRGSPHHSPYGDRVLRARAAALSGQHGKSRGPPLALAKAGTGGRGRGQWQQSRRQRRSSSGAGNAAAFLRRSAASADAPSLSPIQPRGAALRPENRPPSQTSSHLHAAALTPEAVAHVTTAQQQTRAVTPGKVDAYFLGFMEGTKNAAAMIEMQQQLGRQHLEEYELRSQASWADSDTTSKALAVTHAYPSYDPTYRQLTAPSSYQESVLARLGASLSSAAPSGTSAFLDAAYGRRRSPTLERRRRRRIKKQQRVSDKQAHAATKIQALARGRQGRAKAFAERARQHRLRRRAEEQAAAAARMEATARENQARLEATRAAHVDAAVERAQLMATAERELAEAEAAEAAAAKEEAEAIAAERALEKEEAEAIAAEAAFAKEEDEAVAAERAFAKEEQEAVAAEERAGWELAEAEEAEAAAAVEEAEAVAAETAAAKEEFEARLAAEAAAKEAEEARAAEEERLREEAEAVAAEEKAAREHAQAEAAAAAAAKEEEEARLAQEKLDAAEAALSTATSTLHAAEEAVQAESTAEGVAEVEAARAAVAVAESGASAARVEFERERAEAQAAKELAERERAEYAAAQREAEREREEAIAAQAVAEREKAEAEAAEALAAAEQAQADEAAALAAKEREEANEAQRVAAKEREEANEAQRVAAKERAEAEAAREVAQRERAEAEAARAVAQQERAEAEAAKLVAVTERAEAEEAKRVAVKERAEAETAIAAAHAAVEREREQSAQAALQEERSVHNTQFAQLLPTVLKELPPPPLYTKRPKTGLLKRVLGGRGAGPPPAVFCRLFSTERSAAATASENGGGGGGVNKEKLLSLELSRAINMGPLLIAGGGGGAEGGAQRGQQHRRMSDPELLITAVIRPAKAQMVPPVSLQGASIGSASGNSSSGGGGKEGGKAVMHVCGEVARQEAGVHTITFRVIKGSDGGSKGHDKDLSLVPISDKITLEATALNSSAEGFEGAFYFGPDTGATATDHAVALAGHVASTPASRAHEQKIASFGVIESGRLLRSAGLVPGMVGAHATAVWLGMSSAPPTLHLRLTRINAGGVSKLLVDVCDASMSDDGSEIPDPYCKLCIEAVGADGAPVSGEAPEFSQTKTLDNTMHPYWGESFVLELPTAAASFSYRLSCSVWDHDLTSKDDLLGVFSVDDLHSSVTPGEEEPMEIWLESTVTGAALQALG